MDIKIAIYTKYWTWLNLFSLIFLSIFIYVVYFVISHFWEGNLSSETPLFLAQTPHFYLTIILLTFVVLIFDMTIRIIMKELFKNEIDRMLEFKKNFAKLISQHHIQIDNKKQFNKSITRQMEE